MVVHLSMFVFSKEKRRLEKKPPRRSTICTTPRILMKTKGKAPNKGVRQAASGEREGEKKTKGQKKRNKTQKEEGTEKRKKAAQETGSNSSRAKVKKEERLRMMSS